MNFNINRTTRGSGKTCFYCLHIQYKTIGAYRKIQMMTRMEIDNKKVTCTDFGRNVWMYVERITVRFHWFICSCKFHHVIFSI